MLAVYAFKGPESASFFDMNQYVTVRLLDVAIVGMDTSDNQD